MVLALPVGLALCCFVVYSTRRFVLSIAFFFFFFFCFFFFFFFFFFFLFFSPFSIAINSLGEERANLSVFRTFRFALVWFCLSLCLGRIAACDCGTPWTFSLTFFIYFANLSDFIN